MQFTQAIEIARAPDFLGSWTSSSLVSVRQSAPCSQGFSGWQYVKAVNYSSVPGRLFYKRCGLWGHFPHLKPIIFTYTLVLAVVIAQQLNPERFV